MFTGLLAKLGLDAIFGSAGGLLKGVFKWLGSLDLVHFLLLAACLFGGYQTLGRWMQHRHTVKVEAQLGKCTQARAADRAAYTKAQNDAKAQNIAAVAADKAQRERITNDVSQGYEAELASLRTDLGRLHARPGASPGSASPAGVSGVPSASVGPDGQALSLPPDDLLYAAETELQLNALIDWVNKQAKVDPNKP